MTTPFTPAVILPSRDHFSMDRVPFPRVLRARIADADLKRERGEFSAEAHAVLVKSWVDEAMVAQGLNPADGWMWYDTPPARHNPQGLSMVWWRFR